MRPDEIIIITGLPRSGTTLMTRMVEAGGISVYYDQSKPMMWAEGVTEFVNYNRILRETDKIKNLVTGDTEWLNACHGRAVKILTPSKVQIPPGHKCRFIYMDRNHKHVMRSLRKTTARGLTRSVPVDAPDGALRDYLHTAKSQSLKALKRYPDSRLMVLRFEEVLKKPRATALRVARFIDEHMDLEKMAGVVVKRPAKCLPVMLEERIYVEEHAIA